jgi:hypothetical protein
MPAGIGTVHRSPALFPEIYRNFPEVLPYREVLGTFLLAFPELLADRGKVGDAIEETSAEHHVVLHGLLFRIVHIPLVKLLEALMDVHAIRTGHAVPAVGAGYHEPLLKFFSDIPVQGGGTPPEK